MFRAGSFRSPVVLELLVRMTVEMFIAQGLKGLAGAESGVQRSLEPLAKLFIELKSEI